LQQRPWSAELGLTAGVLACFAAWWIEAGPGRHGTRFLIVGDWAISRSGVTVLPLLLCCVPLLAFARWSRQGRLRPLAPALLMTSSALLGFGSLWWLNEAPGPEGRVLWKISPNHGLVEHDLPALPMGALALGLGLAGLLTAKHRLRPRTTSLRRPRRRRLRRQETSD
jgi:hypothetical protein